MHWRTGRHEVQWSLSTDVVPLLPKDGRDADDIHVLRNSRFDLLWRYEPSSQARSLCDSCEWCKSGWISTGMSSWRIGNWLPREMSRSASPPRRFGTSLNPHDPIWGSLTYCGPESIMPSPELLRLVSRADPLPPPGRESPHSRARRERWLAAHCRD
jgi:hypothetical protein